MLNVEPSTIKLPYWEVDKTDNSKTHTIALPRRAVSIQVIPNGEVVSLKVVRTLGKRGADVAWYDFNTQTRTVTTTQPPNRRVFSNSDYFEKSELKLHTLPTFRRFRNSILKALIKNKNDHPKPDEIKQVHDWLKVCLQPTEKMKKDYRLKRWKVLNTTA